MESLLAADPAQVAKHLAWEHARRYRGSEAQQLVAWTRQLAGLRAALATADKAWAVLLEHAVPRLAGRADVVLVSHRCVYVLEFKDEAQPFTPSNYRQAEDYALDLQDFHAGCRDLPVVPLLVATQPGAPPAPAPLPMLLQGTAAPVQACRAGDLWRLLDALERVADVDRLATPAAWAHQPYRPTPGIIEAARIAYTRHGVAEIAAARADTQNLSRTTAAIVTAMAEAAARCQPTILFVTGIPGAGKTLAGLHAAFGPGQDGATFLTGNPTLVHVLREALARDAAAGQRSRLRHARQQMEGKIQQLPRFRDDYVSRPLTIPPERVAVIDEAQRSWSQDYAIRKTRDRPAVLTDSEPGHLLDIMDRRADGPVIVCLVGGGQEIHDGEGGLREWGEALLVRPHWRVLAPPQARTSCDPRQVLPDAVTIEDCHTLHLSTGLRAVHAERAADWVAAVLADDVAAARAIAAAAPPPFVLTRSLAAMRAALRLACARGTRRCGLVASGKAARLRAEGLGVELLHQTPELVAHWFLDRFPGDVRASDALETTASEFAIQGLELDEVGLAWDGDLVRSGGGWLARSFSGTRWTRTADPERHSNRLNAYRVLLTRARYRTIIWVPEGDAADPTRDPSVLDAVAEFLQACGVRPLVALPAPEHPCALPCLP